MRSHLLSCLHLYVLTKSMRPGNGTLLSARLNHTHIIEHARLQCEGQRALHITHSNIRTELPAFYAAQEAIELSVKPYL
jgi:hypothetical protein